MANHFLFNAYSFLIDFLFISYWFPIQLFLISYWTLIHFLFISYSFPIQFLFISSAIPIHFPFIPIHSLFMLVPFISKSFSKKCLIKGLENKVLGLDGSSFPIQFLFIWYWFPIHSLLVSSSIHIYFLFNSYSFWVLSCPKFLKKRN